MRYFQRNVNEVLQSIASLSELAIDIGGAAAYNSVCTHGKKLRQITYYLTHTQRLTGISITSVSRTKHTKPPIMKVRKDVEATLREFGFSQRYIGRAFKVYTNQYGNNYDVEVLTEIIIRLQKKDRMEIESERRKRLVANLLDTI